MEAIEDLKQSIRAIIEKDYDINDDGNTIIVRTQKELIYNCEIKENGQTVSNSHFLLNFVLSKQYGSDILMFLISIVYVNSKRYLNDEIAKIILEDGTGERIVLDKIYSKSTFPIDTDSDKQLFANDFSFCLFENETNFITRAESFKVLLENVEVAGDIIFTERDLLGLAFLAGELDEDDTKKYAEMLIEHLQRLKQYMEQEMDNQDDEQASQYPKAGIVDLEIEGEDF